MPRFERLVADVGIPRKLTAATQRSRTSVAPRRDRASGTNRRSRKAPASRKGARGPTAGDLIKLWFAVAIIVVAILTFRSIANQPCVSPVGCVVPLLYLGMKPLLVLAGAAVIDFGGLATVKWLARNAFR